MNILKTTGVLAGVWVMCVVTSPLYAMEVEVDDAIDQEIELPRERGRALKSWLGKLNDRELAELIVVTALDSTYAASWLGWDESFDIREAARLRRVHEDFTQGIQDLLDNDDDRVLIQEELISELETQLSRRKLTRYARRSLKVNRKLKIFTEMSYPENAIRAQIWLRFALKHPKVFYSLAPISMPMTALAEVIDFVGTGITLPLGYLVVLGTLSGSGL